MRETIIFLGVISGIFCGALLWAGVLYTHGTSEVGWDAFDLLPVAALLLGPLALVAWSIIAARGWRSRTLLWTRRIILYHGIAIGILFPLAIFAGYALPHSTTDDRYIFELMAIPTVLVDLALLGLILKPWYDPELLRLYRKVVLAVGGGALLALAIWPFAVIGLAASEAEIIAGGQPYCIEVSGHGPHGYRSIASLSDMHGLQMYSPWSGGNTRDFQLEFHALLIVQTFNAQLEWRNWSYLQERFVPISDRTLEAMYLGSPSCTPAAHFAWHLPMLSHPEQPRSAGT